MIRGGSVAQVNFAETRQVGGRFFPAGGCGADFVERRRDSTSGSCEELEADDGFVRGGGGSVK